MRQSIDDDIFASLQTSSRSFAFGCVRCRRRRGSATAPCRGCRRAIANQDRHRQVTCRDRADLRAHRTGAHPLGPATRACSEINLEHCPICGGDLKISAAIIEAPVMKRIHSPIRIVTHALPTAAIGPRACKFVGVLWVDRPISQPAAAVAGPTISAGAPTVPAYVGSPAHTGPSCRRRCCAVMTGMPPRPCVQPPAATDSTRCETAAEHAEETEATGASNWLLAAIKGHRTSACAP